MHFPIENRKSSIVWRDIAKQQKTLEAKIEARECKKFLIISKEKPQMLFTFLPFLMTGAFSRTVSPNNPCMLCGLN